MRNTQTKAPQAGEPGDQVVAGTQTLDPVPQVPSTESQQAAIRTVAGPYQFHKRAAFGHDAAAKRAAAAIDKLVRDIAEAQEEIKRQEKVRRDAERDARTEHDQAEAYGLMLDGVRVQRPAIEMDVVQPTEAEIAQHAATWNNSEMPQTDTWTVPPAGHCIRCGKRVWRITVDGQPGLTHAEDVRCDPANPNSPVADLGEEPS